MSDYNSQLPVRSKQDLDERVLIKIQDGDNPGGSEQTAEVSEKKLHTKIFQSDGTNISEENPLPVAPTESAGDEVEDYNESVDVAPTVSANHDYVVTSSKTFKSLNVEAAASGKARFELQVETAASSGSFETRGVKFNSTAKPNVEFKINRPKRVAEGVIIRIVKTNLDEQAQSIYSTINGVEV
jgi:hypothetical protein